MKILRTAILPILPLFLLLLFFSCRNNKETMIIQGIIHEKSGGKIYLSKVTPDGLSLIDSSELTKGNFRFKIKSEDIARETPAFYQISIAPQNAFTTLIQAGEKINIEANAESLIKTYMPTGSKDATLIWQLDQNLKQFIDTVDQLYAIYSSFLQDDNVREQIEARYNRLTTNHENYLLNFISENGNSLASVTAFYQTYNRKRFIDEIEHLDVLKQLYDELSRRYPENETVLFLEKRIETISFSLKSPFINEKL